MKERMKSILAGIGLILTLVAAGFAIISFIAPRPVSNVILQWYDAATSEPVIITVERISVVTNTPDPMSAAEVAQVEVTRLVTVVAAESEGTNTPAHTLTPTDTPVPTDTPIPTPTREWPTIIEEDFSEPLNEDLWTIEGTRPSYINGEMVSIPSENDPLLLFIGDETWKNYTVEFVMRAVNCGAAWTNLIGVRVRDPGNMVSYNYTGCATMMYLWRGGEALGLPNTETDIDAERIRIEATNTNILVFINGAQRINYTIPDEAYLNGGVFMRIKSGTFDHISITHTD